jgi:predicted ATPase
MARRSYVSSSRKVRAVEFAGGWTLEAAEAIAGVESATTLQHLKQLVDKSLVNAAMRYGMLETIRAYASEKLYQSGEADLLRAPWRSIRRRTTTGAARGR